MAHAAGKPPACCWVLALVCLSCIFATAVLAAEPRFPPLTGRVVDEAQIISPSARDRITGWLDQYERETKRQVVVVTVKSLQGFPIEDFGYRLGRFWSIGQQGKNTGAILLVAPNERTVRIEVGYGLEGELTDAASRAIIEQAILPAFRQGNYEQGIVAGTLAILRTLGWKGDAGAAVAKNDDNGGGLPPVAFIVFVILFMVLRYGRHGLWIAPFGYGTWGSGSGGRFSGTGGSFGGGGGSFGGGGASGRW